MVGNRKYKVTLHLTGNELFEVCWAVHDAAWRFNRKADEYAGKEGWGSLCKEARESAMWLQYLEEKLHSKGADIEEEE